MLDFGGRHPERAKEYLHWGTYNSNEKGDKGAGVFGFQAWLTKNSPCQYIHQMNSSKRHKSGETGPWTPDTRPGNDPLGNPPTNREE